MTFLHWSYDPAVVARLLPEGLEVDTHGGRAWIGLTPFRVERFRVSGLPAVPGLSSFPETNVRTYVRGPDGRDGIWFFSLEVDSLATTLGARATYGVPYHWADMSVEVNGSIRYRSRRRGDDEPAVGHDISVVRQDRYAPGEATAFEHWLTGRWRAYTRIGGNLAVVPIEHPPWHLWRARLDAIDENLLTAAGLPAPEGAPLVHHADPVDVRLARPHRVGGGHSGFAHGRAG